MFSFNEAFFLLTITTLWLLNFPSLWHTAKSSHVSNCNQTACHLNGLTFWVHVSDRITISPFRRPMYTELGRIMTYCERISALNQTIFWSIWDHVKILKILICASSGRMTTNISRYWLRGRGLARSSLSSYCLF